MTCTNKWWLNDFHCCLNALTELLPAFFIFVKIFGKKNICLI